MYIFGIVFGLCRGEGVTRIWHTPRGVCREEVEELHVFGILLGVCEEWRGRSHTYLAYSSGCVRSGEGEVTLIWYTPWGV